MLWKILGLHGQRVTSTIDLSVHEHIRIGTAAVCATIICSCGSTTVRLLNVVVSDLKIMKNVFERKHTYILYLVNIKQAFYYISISTWVTL